VKIREVRSADVSSLIESYVVAAEAHEGAIERGDHRVANKNADLLRAVSQELKARGSDALQLLLGHEVPSVRAWSATHLLSSVPAQAEPVLAALAELPGLTGFDCRMVLKQWSEGTWSG
jgi:Domain of unknown function (DUF2019)